MANTKTAVKRGRQSKERNIRNRKVKSHLKRAVKDFYQTINQGDSQQAWEAYSLASSVIDKAAYSLASSVIDKAASKGVIHKRTAARKKSRLAQKLNSQAS